MKLEYVLRKAAEKAKKQDMTIYDGTMGFPIEHVLGEPDSPSYQITVSRIYPRKDKRRAGNYKFLS